MSDERSEALQREYQRLIDEGVDLRHRHEALERTPFDHLAHEAHIRRLHAHLEALHAYLAQLPRSLS